MSFGVKELWREGNILANSRFPRSLLKSRRAAREGRIAIETPRLRQALRGPRSPPWAAPGRAAAGGAFATAPPAGGSGRCAGLGAAGAVWDTRGRSCEAAAGCGGNVQGRLGVEWELVGSESS